MRLNRAIVVLGALAAAACGDSSDSPPTDLCASSGAAATVVATDSYAFTPSIDTITVGQSVCWVNTGTLTHTVTATVGPRFNGTLPGEQTFVHTFGFGGGFSYFCRNHSNMTGEIVVKCRPGEISC